MASGLRRARVGKFGGGLLIDSFIGAGDFDEEIGESEFDSFYGILRGDLVEIARQGAQDEGETLTLAEEKFLKSQAGAIVNENSQGFVDVSYYADDEELEEAWDEAVETVNEMEETEDADYD